MQIDPNLRFAAETVLQYPSWRGLPAPSPQRHVIGWRPLEDALPGWQRHERLSPVGIDANTTRSTSTWTQANRLETLSVVEVYECRSRIDAHENLVALAASFEFGFEPSSATPKLGEIAFAGRGGTLLFALANLAARVIRGDTGKQSLLRVASCVEATLLAAQAATSTQIVQAAALGDRFAINLPPPAGWRPDTHVLSSTTGRFENDAGIHWFIAETDGVHTVTLDTLPG